MRTALSFALVAPALGQTLWSGVCGDSVCSKQGNVVGPAMLNNIWSGSISGSQAVAIALPGGAKQALVPSSQYCAAQQSLCPGQSALDAATGSTLYSQTYNSITFSPSTYNFGVPAILAGGNGQLTISGQGWKSDANGSFLSTLFAVDSATGAMQWTLHRNDGLWGDLAASTDPTSPSAGLVFALFSANSTVFAINASTGGVAWSHALASYTSDDTAVTYRKIVLDDKGSTAFVTDTSSTLDAPNGMLASLNLASRTLNWQVTAWPSGGGPLSYTASKPSYDPTTGLIVIVNGSNIIGIDSKAGQGGLMPLPDPIDPLTRAGFANHASAPPQGTGGHFFVWTTISSGDPTASGMPVLYAIAKDSGSVVGRYTFDNTSDYMKWGDGIALDASGTRLYVSLLGPLIPSLQTSSGANISISSGARGLQGGGSVYLAVVDFDPSSGTFSSKIVPAPKNLQAGMPLIAVGPAAGQITVAGSSCNGVALMGDAA